MSNVGSFSHYIAAITNEYDYVNLMKQNVKTNGKKRARDEIDETDQQTTSQTDDVSRRTSKRLNISTITPHSLITTTPNNVDEWRSSVSELVDMLNKASDAFNESFEYTCDQLDEQIEYHSLAEFHRGLDGERRDWQHLGKLWVSDVQQARRDINAIELYQPELVALDVPDPAPSMQLDWFLQHYRDAERRLNQREKELKERENRTDVRVKQARNDLLKEITELREKVNLLRTANDMTKSKEKRERKALLDKADDARKAAELREKQAVDEVRRLQAMCAQLQGDMNKPRVKQEPDFVDESRVTALHSEISRLTGLLSAAQSDANNKQAFIDELQAALTVQSTKLKDREKVQITLNETIAKLESDLLEANMQNEILSAQT